MYSLRESPRDWFHRLRDYLIKIEFKEGIVDPLLFVFLKDGISTYFLIYVNDIVITSSSSDFITEVVQ